MSSNSPKLSVSDICAIAGVICTGSFLLNTMVTSTLKFFRSYNEIKNRKLQSFISLTLYELQQHFNQLLHFCRSVLLFGSPSSNSVGRCHLRMLQDLTGQEASKQQERNPGLRPRQDGEFVRFDDVKEAVIRFSKSWPHQTYLGRSTFENGDISLYAKHQSFHITRYHGEILRVSRKDESMRIVLHKEDASLLNSQGWSSVQSTGIVNISAGSSGTQIVRLHIPQTEAELELLSELMRAALATASTCSFGPDEENEIAWE